MLRFVAVPILWYYVRPEKRDREEGDLAERIDNHVKIPVPEFIDPVFAKTSQNARFLLSENERFGLVFCENRVYKFGHWISAEYFFFFFKRNKFAEKSFHYIHLLYNITILWYDLKSLTQYWGRNFGNANFASFYKETTFLFFYSQGSKIMACSCIKDIPLT